MASLIKNQILKHLSKFAKNLSPDKINLSTFKGEGELTNLELNENVLADLLELPTWLKLTKAVCNKVNIKIQWTKLKSVPLSLYLDELVIEMETTEQLRQVSPHATRPSYSSGGKYGFSDSVIDGMMVAINSVEVKFTSSAFHASFQLSRLRLESRTPNWHRSDLRMTRLKDPDRGELLIFKELEWQTLRVEAAATDPKSAFTTPLRLITNQARCRITIKKRVVDCGVLASRLVLIFDDLLWVLTDSQIQAALHFISSLSGLIRKAAEVEKKIKAAQKLESMPSQSQLSQQSAAAAAKGSGRAAMNNVARVFVMHDIVETSCHVYSSRIDLHFCDDAKPEEERSSNKSLTDGAAMQVTLTKLAVDYYPYHFAFADRKHWLRYNEANTSHATWVDQLMAAYRQQLLELVNGEAPPARGTQSPKQRSPSHGQPTSPQAQEDRRRSSGQSKSAVVATFLKSLMSSCVVVRLDDFVVYQVSTAATRKRVPEKFLSSDKGRLMLPASMPAVHLEFTEYYFPGDDVFPVPVANVHAHVNPIQITLETVTVLWLNTFLLSLEMSQLRNSIDQLAQVFRMPDTVRPVDIRLEALMPRVVIPATKEYSNQPDRPRSLQVQISRLTATNCRVGENCGLAQLQDALETFQSGSLFLSPEFPVQAGDLNPLHEAFYLHSMGEDAVEASSVEAASCTGGAADSYNWDANAAAAVAAGQFDAAKGEANEDVVVPLPPPPSALRKDLLWTENKAVWCVLMEPLWIDFCGMESCRNRPSPFMDAVQAAFWIVQNVWCPGVPPRPSSSSSSSPSSPSEQPPPPGSSPEEVPTAAAAAVPPPLGRQPSAYVLAQFKSLVSVQVNHFQYLFLLRAAEMLAEMTAQLADDTGRIKGRSGAAKVCVALIVPELDVSLVSPVKKGMEGGGETESLGGDLSSSAGTTGGATTDGGGGGGGGVDMARTASTTFSMRESLSDNHISGGGAAEHLTASCSDYALGPAAPPTPKGAMDAAGRDVAADAIAGKEAPFQRDLRNSNEKRFNDFDRKQQQQHLSADADSSRQAAPPTSSSSSSAAAALPNGHPAGGARAPPPSNAAVTHKIAGFFAHQGPSRSVDIFTAPLLEMASFENVPDKLGKTFASGSSAMKKGFSSLVASFDSALSTPKSPTPLTSPIPPLDTQSFHSGDSYAGDDFDAMSLCSDLSDSDQFVLLNSESNFLDENLLGAGGQDPSLIEVASEVKEDSSSEQSVASSFKRQDLMQVVTFRLGIVEAVQQLTGADSVVKVKAQYLHSEELGTMTWEEFQAKFSAGARAWQEDAIKYTLPTCDVRARYQKGPATRPLCEEAESRGFLEVLVSAASLSLLMSSVASLTDLLEDELVPVSVPMKLAINDVKLNLQEDRPSSNITSPGPMPISVAVTGLVVTRKPDGTFHIHPAEPDAEDPTSAPLWQQPLSTEDAEAQTEDGTPPPPPYLERADSQGRRRRPSLDDLDEVVYQLQEENEQLRLKVIELEAARRDAEEGRGGGGGSSSVRTQGRAWEEELMDEKQSMAAAAAAAAAMQTLQEQVTPASPR